jgi:tRNA(Ile)-lysidine synthase
MTAHHRDDQAETFLFRLAKGSGLDGLAGIRPVSDYNAALTLVRPLLDMGKDQLVAYCEQAAIPFVRDPTNADLSYARNRLRAAMAVLGLEGLSAKRLAVTARRMMQARQALDHYAQCADKAARIATYADEIIYDYEKLSGEPEETRRRVLMMAMAEMQAGRAYAPRMEKLEALAAALFSDPAFTRATLGGFVIGRDVGARRVTVAREAVKKPETL